MDLYVSHDSQRKVAGIKVQINNWRNGLIGLKKVIKNVKLVHLFR